MLRHQFSGASPISPTGILSVASLLALIAFLKGMRWEEIAAFIGGPAMLLLLIQAGNKSLKDATTPSTPIAQTGTLETAAIGVETTTNTLNTLNLLIIIAIPICILILILSLNRALQPTTNPSRFKKKWTNFFRFLPLRIAQQSQSHHYTKTHTNSPNALYYETAVRLGALIAQSDGHVGPHQLTVVKRIFNLTRANCPQADSLYAQQLREGLPMSAVIKPFIASYGKGSAVCETLIFGMACVAMSDQQVVSAELGLLRMAADMLGIPPAHTKRILMFSGYFGEQRTSNTYQRSSSNTHQRTAPKSERERHLATLGLKSGANKTEIRKAWRKLATKYHPDKLVSQNLPPQEMEKAENMMQAVNVAYDWLKDNTP